MPLSSNISSRYRMNNVHRIVQGDIFKDVDVLDWEIDTNDINKFNSIKRHYPYIVVLTQDCDLLWDFRNWMKNNIPTPDTEGTKKRDKYLQSILVSPAYYYEQFKNGDHLGVGKMEKINSETKLNNIKNNTEPRYHYLNADATKQIPELVIDFKHYYSIPIFYLYHYYAKWYVASLNELFRESLSQRFSFFLSRVGLPEIQEIRECNEIPN